MSKNSNIKVRRVNKPFIVSALALVLAGSTIGSIWMMSLLGASIPFMHGLSPLHKVFQVHGFLSLFIMGIGYMIVPRFRNTNLPSLNFAYISLSLVVLSIIISVISSTADNRAIKLGALVHFFGVAIFAAIVIWMLRIRPRLLHMADYFIILSIITLLAINVMKLLDLSARDHLSEVQLWLLFPILMIFGIEYKTLFWGLLDLQKTCQFFHFISLPYLYHLAY